MKRWLETRGYLLVWDLALRKGPVWRWLHDAWAGYWYSRYCPYPTHGNWKARACVAAGGCGCNNLDRYPVPNGE